MIGHPLDNPVWHALDETHKDVSIHYDDARFYRLPYATFGAIRDTSVGYDDILKYGQNVDPIIIVGSLPKTLPKHWRIVSEAQCSQMICHALHDSQIKPADEIVALDESHKQALFDLISMVQPGYFFSETQSLGQYFGIWKDGQLVAAAGERLKLHAFTEVSGVVTHPDYTKLGYATQLVQHTTSHVLNHGKTPFLHVLATNSKAISIYAKIGYTHRRLVTWYKISTMVLGT